ncbi:MAG: methyltransferase domain-containing protein [Myxococcaceae bacterium]|nr:methyltransferase domain-containing protein [Myxococcaceae bacterium]
MDIMLREFGRYVEDAHRTKLFARAIAEQVRPGDVVLDLGTGFGLLALLAARQGAARVYAVEQEPRYLELAHALARDNRLDDRIHWLPGNSSTVALPEQVDVVISETLGQFALEEFTVEYLFDARARFLKPGGRMIPERLALFLTPVELSGPRQRLGERYGESWADISGFDLRRLRQAVLENEVLPYQVHTFGDGDRTLGHPVEAASFVLGQARSSRFLRAVTCKVDQPGTLDGFLGTFEARLSASAVLSTRPEEHLTHWRQVVFPVLPPRSVEEGTPLAVELGFHGGAGWSYLVQP